MRNTFFCCLLALIFAVLFVACNEATDGAEGDQFRVVTTTSMLADLASEIGGDRVSVQGLMGPGVDPHLYRASEGDVSRMARADIILYNGLDLEGRMTEVFSRMRQQGRQTVAVAEESVGEEDRIVSQEYGGSYDPHIWFDVRLWMMAAEHVAGIFSEEMPENSDYFSEQLDDYLAELEELQSFVVEETQRVPEEKRVLITSHDAFGYFGKGYNYEVRGLQGLSTDTEAGTADVQQLADFIAERQIPSIFMESSVSPRGIEAVREAVRSRGYNVELGGTLFGDALGDPETEEGTYVGAIRHNVETVVSGLMREV